MAGFVGVGICAESKLFAGVYFDFFFCPTKRSGGFLAGALCANRSRGGQGDCDSVSMGPII